MLQSNLQNKSLQKSRHVEGLWVSYTKGKTKISKPRREAKEVALSPLRGLGGLFVVNESLHDVYFDDMSATIRRHIIIQEGHYNPFGMPLVNPEYAYFFTGKELCEDEALQWYDYGARMGVYHAISVNVQIGRWTSHDPEYQDASPYVFCGNNGVNYVDMDGRKWGFLDYAATVLTGGIYGAGKLLHENRQDIDEWFARNEKTIINVGFTVVGIGLAFVPWVNILGAMGIAAVLGAGQSVYNTQGMDNSTRWQMAGLGALIGAGSAAAGYGSSQIFKNAFLDMGVHAGMALQGAVSGALSGAFVGGITSAIYAPEGEKWNAFGKGALIGAGTGAVMGAAMGYAMSFRKSAGANWQQRRNFRGAFREMKTMNNSEKSQNYSTDEDVARFQDENPNLKKVVDGLRSDDSNICFETTDSYIDSQGNRVQLDASNPAATIHEPMGSKGFDHQVKLSNSAFKNATPRQFYKAIMHESAHIYKKNFFYNNGGFFFQGDETFIKSNFWSLRTGIY